MAAGETAQIPVEVGRPVLLFVVNVAWFFCMHRLHLAVAAKKAGYDVHVATAPDTAADVSLIREAGLTYHPLDLRRGSWSLLEELGLVRQLYRLKRKLRPVIVHHVTIKPVLCGTVAALLAGTPGIVNAMSGLGFIFTTQDRWAFLRRAVVSTAYRVLFSSSRVRVIFENTDDLRSFREQRIVDARRSVLIRGAGVDLQRFRPQPRPQGVPLVVLPARMLWDKGVGEFCAMAQSLREAGVVARFALVGGVDPGNPAAIEKAWLDEQRARGAVEWWGHQSDMASVYAQAHVVCLPSYREGLPTVLLEAAACGCALVTTDVPGCREVVTGGQTGWLVPARDAISLAGAVREAVTDAGLREQFASAARERVSAAFSAEKVRADTLDLYRTLLTGPSSR